MATTNKLIAERRFEFEDSKNDAVSFIAIFKPTCVNAAESEWECAVVTQDGEWKNARIARGVDSFQVLKFACEIAKIEADGLASKYGSKIRFFGQLDLTL
jgi:hypothetical protein